MACSVDEWEARMPPLFSLSDEQMDTVRRAAEPLHPVLRAPFLQTVANLLAGEAIGDGSVARACREAQREFVRPRAPEVSRLGTGKYR
jgi:hypothetical protein